MPSPSRNCASSLEKLLQLCVKRLYVSLVKRGAISCRKSSNTSFGMAVLPSGKTSHGFRPNVASTVAGGSACTPAAEEVLHSVHLDPGVRDQVELLASQLQGHGLGHAQAQVVHAQRDGEALLPIPHTTDRGRLLLDLSLCLSFCLSLGFSVCLSVSVCLSRLSTPVRALRLSSFASLRRTPLLGSSVGSSCLRILY